MTLRSSPPPPVAPAELSSVRAVYDDVASRYDDILGRSAGDQMTRRLFQERLLAQVPPGGLVLDYGCGTGIDARRYVEAGRRVLAYDLSAGMVAELQARCRAEVDAGRIEAFWGDRDDCQRRLAGRAATVDAVTANFAVLNTIADPGEVFRVVEPVVRPGGWVQVSVINPFYLREVLHPRGWSALVRQLASGRLPHPAGMPVHAHLPWVLERAAAPAFRLEWRGSIGSIVDYEADLPLAGAGRVRAWLEAAVWERFPANRLGRFLLLGFRRR